ncbi:hypothetical protein ACJX0J_020839, partial [Zea mays]
YLKSAPIESKKIRKKAQSQIIFSCGFCCLSFYMSYDGSITILLPFFFLDIYEIKMYLLEFVDVARNYVILMGKPKWTYICGWSFHIMLHVDIYYETMHWFMLYFWIDCSLDLLTDKYFRMFDLCSYLEMGDGACLSDDEDLDFELSKKEMKNKELAELDVVLAELGLSGI